MYATPRYLHVLTHSVPTRRSADLVGGGEFDHVIVIPQACQGLVRVVARIEHRVVMVPELTGFEKVHREPVALAGGMRVVQMGGESRIAERNLDVFGLWHVVESTHEHQIGRASCRARVCQYV